MTGAVRPRPPHLRPSSIALVAVGGALGTAARVAITLIVPSWGTFDTAIFAINVVGAFVLGALLEGLMRSGPDEGRRRRARLFFGTGVLGGFTTYSSLATETATLAGAAGPSGTDVTVAVLYGLLSIVLGALAAGAGISLARRVAGGSR